MFLIRITRYFYIDSLVIIMVFLAYCIGKLPELLILYGAVVIHEAAHFIACTAFGERIKELRFMVYGANLCTDYIVNPVHLMIVSAAGPLMSGLLILISGGFQSQWMQIFKISNIVVFALNIFPALPLDGGNFFKGLLTYRLGYVRAHRRMIEITRVGIAIMGFFGIIFVLLSKYNISLLVISAFLLYNLKEERKKLFFIRQLIYTKEFDRKGKILKIENSAVIEGVSAASLTDRFGYNYICHFFVYNSSMKLIGTLNQSEIIDGIIEYGADVTVGKLINVSAKGGNNEYKRQSIRNIAQSGKADPIYR